MPPSTVLTSVVVVGIRMREVVADNALDLLQIRENEKPSHQDKNSTKSAERNFLLLLCCRTITPFTNSS